MENIEKSLSSSVLGEVKKSRSKSSSSSSGDRNDKLRKEIQRKEKHINQLKKQLEESKHSRKMHRNPESSLGPQMSEIMVNQKDDLHSKNEILVHSGTVKIILLITKQLELRHFPNLVNMVLHP